MLDPEGRADIMKLICELAKDEKRPILMIIHHLDEAVYDDRLVVLNNGEIIKSGTSLCVFDDIAKVEKRRGLN